MDARWDRRIDRGQVLVIFTLALVAIVAMTGLVIDGGDTFVQRRDMQNVADAAAMAGGYAYGVAYQTTYASTGDTTQAQQAGKQAGESAARDNAVANGYSAAELSSNVTPKTNGSMVVVTVTRAHRNWFVGILGMASWQVSATATVKTGVPTGIYGLMPIIVNARALAGYAWGTTAPSTFSEPPSGSGDIPQDATTFNWTNYCTSGGNTCNADSTSVDNLIQGGGVGIQVTLQDSINPLNAGSHATLYSSLASEVGAQFPIAIVNDAGQLQGWALFNLTGSVGGSTKQISGYFSQANEAAYTVDNDRPAPNVWTGAYSVKLTN